MPSERRQKEIASLSQRKHRERLGQFVLEGSRSLESALDGNAQIREVLLATSTELDPALRNRLARKDIQVEELPDRLSARLAHTRTPSGILAVADIPAASLEGVDRILMLDALQDPGNVGTLVRTAAWFGIGAVVAGPGTADFFSPKTVRATMGGLWDVQLMVAASLPETIAGLCSQGFGVWSADIQGTDHRTWKPVPPSVLVIGSEAHGVSAEVAALLDGRVSIRGGSKRQAAESLNAAVAGAILMASWTE